MPDHCISFSLSLAACLDSAHLVEWEALSSAPDSQSKLLLRRVLSVKSDPSGSSISRVALMSTYEVIQHDNVPILSINNCYSGSPSSGRHRLFSIEASRNRLLDSYYLSASKRSLQLLVLMYLCGSFVDATPKSPYLVKGWHLKNLTWLY